MPPDYVHRSNHCQHTQTPFLRTFLVHRSSKLNFQCHELRESFWKAWVPHHPARQQVFFQNRDYSRYLDLLTELPKEASDDLAYCLMPNHVHLIAVPECTMAMAQAMGRTNADFARCYNPRKRSCGVFCSGLPISTLLTQNPRRICLVFTMLQTRRFLDAGPWLKS